MLYKILNTGSDISFGNPWDLYDTNFYLLVDIKHECLAYA